MAKLKWIIGAIVGLLIIAGIVLYYPLTQISVESIEITNVKDITAKGFTLEGNLYINNPSVFTVPITSADYQFVLKKTNEMLFSGTLPTFTLESRTTTTVPFNMRVIVKSTANLALLAATQKEVNATISGIAHADLFGFAYDSPFETEIDLKELITS